MGKFPTSKPPAKERAADRVAIAKALIAPERKAAKDKQKEAGRITKPGTKLGGSSPKHDGVAWLLAWSGVNMARQSNTPSAVTTSKLSL